jgi:hypothetical protein
LFRQGRGGGCVEREREIMDDVVRYSEQIDMAVVYLVTYWFNTNYL